ncbi:MAG: phage portal protein [Bacillota bacterium]|nr:phage portal protein [Bacillota bacterium]
MGLINFAKGLANKLLGNTQSKPNTANAYGELPLDAQASATPQLPGLAQIIQLEVTKWLYNTDSVRKAMLESQRYYLNKTDIFNKRIDEKKGHSSTNSKLSCGILRNIVDQKVGYLLSKTPTIKTQNKTYLELLNEIFDADFWRMFKNACKDAIVNGVGWVQPYFDNGSIKFRRIQPEEIRPIWLDGDHTKLDAIIRIYEAEMYTVSGRMVRQKVEYWDDVEVQYFEYNADMANNVGFNSAVFPDYSVLSDYENGFYQYKTNHFELDTGIDSDLPPQPFGFGRPPFVAIKYNAEEQPILQMVKPLIDNYELQASTNADLLADIPKFIYILQNYGGDDLDAFLENLRRYGVIGVESDGGVNKLSADPQTASVEQELLRTRRDIYSASRAVDYNSSEIANAASGLAIKLRSRDLEIDSNQFENEIKAAFDELLFYVDTYLHLTEKGDFTNEKADIILNRDKIITDAEIIQNARNVVGLVSEETILTYLSGLFDFNVNDEQQRIKNETETEPLQPSLDAYTNKAYTPTPTIDSKGQSSVNI